MKYEVSDIIDPVPVENRGRPLDGFREALNAIPLGKAVIVKGMTGPQAAVRSNAAGRAFSPRRKFSTATLPDGSGIQITRVL